MAEERPVNRQNPGEERACIRGASWLCVARTATAFSLNTILPVTNADCFPNKNRDRKPVRRRCELPCSGVTPLRESGTQFAGLLARADR